MRQRVVALATMIVWLLLVRSARAELTAYEGFDYQAGSTLLGSNGGFGFSDAWQAGGFNASDHTNYTVASGSLMSPGLLASGNDVTTGALSAIGGITRDLSTPLGTPGTTEYLSVLLRPEGTLGQGYLNGFFGLYLNASTGQDLFLGKPGAGATDQYVLENRGGADQHASGTSVVVGQTTLLVLRMDFMEGTDKFTLYVNPTPGAPEPSSGTVKQDSYVGTVSALTIYSTGAFDIDEIRIGDTFADVTPQAAAVPEPASFTLAGLGILGLIGYGWRRRKSAA